MLVDKIALMIKEQGNRHGLDWASDIIKNLITECRELMTSNEVPVKLHTRLVLLTIFSESTELAQRTVDHINNIGLIDGMITSIKTNYSVLGLE